MLFSTSINLSFTRPLWQDFVNNELNFIFDKNNNNDNVICYDRSFDSKWLIQGKNTKLFLEMSGNATLDENKNNNSLTNITMRDETNGNTVACGDLWQLSFLYKNVFI